MRRGSEVVKAAETGVRTGVRIVGITDLGDYDELIKLARLKIKIVR